jgi:hypothetical protein
MGIGKRSNKDFLPVMKYDGRTGEFSLINRVQNDDDEWESVASVIAPKDFRAVPALDVAEVGWVAFPSGQAPDTALVAAGDDAAARWGEPPTENHKLGVRLIWKMPGNLGGGIRELLGTSIGLWNGIDALMDAYAADADKQPGKLPVVTLAKVQEHKSRNGTTYTPVFKIATWAPRPTELPNIPPLATRTESIPQATAKPSASAKPPAEYEDEIPFWPRAKEPAIHRGLKAATTDVNLIIGWWRGYPDCNIGMATGVASGVFVIDIDGENGESGISMLERQHGVLPPTVESITGRGRHLFFAWPSATKIRNSAGSIASGIDVRGDGGYVLLPPSIHPSGAPYLWSPTSAKAFAIAPDWLLAALAPGKRASSRASSMPTSRWRDLAQGLSEGARNTGMIQLSGYLLRRRVDPFVVLALMQGFNATRCTPPLAAEDVTRIVDSISGRELKRREA